jgi:alpha-amylase
MNRLAIFFFLLLALIVSISLISCRESKPAEKAETKAADWTKPRAPDWHKNANIYEVNIRNYTEAGTFEAFSEHIPRLAEMGVDILWFMPVHPVSKEKRKGELGSPYAVGDYRDVNPRFGTMDDFKAMLNAIHDAGMRLIIDWVPNHTGWDNPWITEHPDWYTKGADGEITDPINAETGESWGWTDVADLNYDNPEMRLGMIEAMRFWVNEVGIDGFRVDVAHGVPVDFWAQCSDSLYKDGEVFLLAEAEVPAIVNNGAFVMDYGWEMHHILNEIAKSQGANRKAAVKLVKGNLVNAEGEEVERKTALEIDRVLAKYDSMYTNSKGFKMHFTSNHDENSWAGTEMDRMGDGHKAFAVLTATFDGMPLLYTGQESAMDKQLEFFKKDNIDWGDYSYAGFYKTLFDLKHKNKALWNGEYGGELVKIPTGKDEEIYAFYREKDGNRVVVVINLSSSAQDFTLNGDSFAGDYTDVFLNAPKTLTADLEMSLDPWDYAVYAK